MINGGRIDATGADYCAGIGGADGKSGYRSITINSGSVTATGGFNAAGIGGGDEANGTLGPVTINGGTVKAKGNNHGAGIGGGDRRSGGPVTINGGTVEATGGSWVDSDKWFNNVGSGAGIGGGLFAAQGGKVTINGGSVKAVGGRLAAGIGGGSSSSSASTSNSGGPGGDVLITGGTVVARTKGGGAAIGGAEYAPAGNIEITGGTVDAGFEGKNVTLSDHYGCGIGAGYGCKKNTGSVTITGGTVTATGNNCAGIGGVATVRITGGDVAAESAFGAGIGGSYYMKNSCKVTIEGGNVIASSIAGGAGIGSGLFGENAGASVTIIGGKVWAFGHTRYLNLWAETVGGAAAGNSMKWAKMHDRTQTGGNIASLAGSIGDALMMLIFNAVYSGEYCGAGIGGGYKDNGCPVTITGGEVFAAASKSGAHAIGRGLSGKKDGSLGLGDTLTVCAGNDPTKLEWKKAAERVSACQQSLAAYIEPCEHEFTYQDFDGVDHYAGACKYCLARKDGKIKLNHVFDEKTHTCICGHKEIILTREDAGEDVAVTISDRLNPYRNLKPGQTVYISEDVEVTVSAACKEGFIPVITASHQGAGGKETILTPESTSQMTDNGTVTEIHTYWMTDINPDSGVTLEVASAEACKVTFSPGDAGPNPGVYDMVPVYVPAGQPYTIPACEYEKNPGLTNKAFQGWKLSGGRVADGESAGLFRPGAIVYPLDDLTFTAQWDDVVTYPLWVNGMRVTAENKDDVLGDGSGSIRFDSVSDTLILNNPRLFTGGTSDDAFGVGLIYAERMNLTVKGVGTVASAVKSNESGILVNNGTLTIGGYITVDASNYGVYAENGIEFLADGKNNTAIIIRSNWKPAVSVKTEGTIIMADDLRIVTPVNGKTGKTAIQDASGIDAKTVEIMSSLIFSFYPGGGTGKMEPVTIPAGTSYTLPPCTFTPPAGDYTFRCWYINNEEYTNGHELKPDELNRHSQKGYIYATAIWEKQGYTLKEWEWQDESEPPTAKAIFTFGGIEDPRSARVTIDTENSKEPTCTEAGSIVYTAEVTDEYGVKYTDSHTKTLPATGHTAGTAVRENEKVATCTEAGSYDLLTRCSQCGVELKRTREGENALGHAWSEWKHGETADYRECTRCKLKESKGSKACDHLMIIEPAVEPTCTAQGHKAFYHCAKCMGIYADRDGNEELLYENVMLPAKGHTAGIPSRQNEQPATCTETGSYEEIITCTVCGGILSSEIKTGDPALGHDYMLSAWDWAEDYTAAEAIFICRRNPSHQVVVSADVSVERVEPTCISEGREKYIAKVNFGGKTYKDEETILKKTGHIPAVKEHIINATCTQDGSYEETVYCTYCGQELSRTFVQEKAFGHDWERITRDGQQYLHCKNCGIELEIPSHEHDSETLVYIEKADATCTQQGYSRDFYRCKQCMELFWDAKGEAPITDADLTNLVIPALGHEGGNPERINIRPATCTQPGSYDEAVYCTRCGSLLSLKHFDDAVEPLGHDYGEPVWNWTDDNSAATATFTCSRDAGHKLTEKADIVVTRMEPGCEEDGWVHVFASVWRNGILYYDEKLAGLPKTGHKKAPPVRINIVQAGCETAGSYDEAVYCEHCGKLFSSIHHENAVPPLGHLWSEWARQGDKLMRTCSRCEAVQEIGEAPHVHQMKPDPGREATCIETGVTPGFVCTICGGHFADVDGTQEAEILPLKAHTPGEVEILFDPEDLSGYYECVYCTVCGTMLSLDWVDEEHYLGYYYSDTTRVWVKGSGMPATFTVKRSEQDQKTYDLFQYISVDGATVDRRFYTRASGSLILTLLPDYLETLSLGRHTLTTVFYDGQASADFVVITPGSGSGNYSGSGTIDYIYNPQAKTVSNNPRTGDDSRLALWGILAAVSAAGVVVLTAKKRKRREN